MTSYDRRWIRSGPLTRLARRHRGRVRRLGVPGFHGSAAGRSQIWRDLARRVPPELRRSRA